MNTSEIQTSVPVRSAAPTAPTAPTAPMDIQIKNVKHSQFASQETNCFEASVWIDGKKEGFAENSGHGGCTFVSWDNKEIRERVEAYVGTLPAVITDMENPKGEGMFTYLQSIDGIVDELLETFLYSKDLKKKLAKRVVFFQETDHRGKFVEGGLISQTKALSKDRLAQLLAQGAGWLTKHYEVNMVLNLLPFDEALKIFRGVKY